jgi:NAD(P)-dependent dehydrogenase (short-subunit alcohol dehydrogenase family)
LVGELSDRVALVTGASRGIGRAIAIALGARGARVGLVARCRERLRDVAEATPGDALVLAGDLTRGEFVQELVEEVRSAFGRLDVLVHSAGSIALAPAATASLADLDGQWISNVRAPWALTRRLLPLLVDSGGDVVFVNSSVVRHPRPEAGQFAATQHALRGIADCLRQELNPLGVRVLSIFPGRTATPRQEWIFAHERRSYVPENLLQPEDVASAVLCALLMPRSAELTELHIRPMKAS